MAENTKKLYDAAGNYFIQNPGNVYSVFNDFCERNNIKLNFTDSCTILDIFNSLNTTNKEILRNFLSYINGGFEIEKD